MAGEKVVDASVIQDAIEKRLAINCLRNPVTVPVTDGCSTCGGGTAGYDYNAIKRNLLAAPDSELELIKKRWNVTKLTFYLPATQGSTRVLPYSR